MFFVFDTYRALSFIARCSSVTRYAISISFISLIIFMWWYFCYYPITYNTISYSQKIRSLNNQKKKIIEDYAKYNLLKQEVNNLKLKFTKQINSVSGNSDRALTFIIDCCTKNKLKLNKYSEKERRASVPNVKKWYAQNLYEFNLEGSYINLVNFFESISYSDNFIECQSCDISSIEDNVLSVNLVLKVLIVNQKGSKK